MDTVSQKPYVQDPTVGRRQPPTGCRLEEYGAGQWAWIPNHWEPKVDLSHFRAALISEAALTATEAEDE